MIPFFNNEQIQQALTYKALIGNQGQVLQSRIRTEISFHDYAI